MKPMLPDAYKKVTALQSELSIVAQAIATEIAKPASQRNGACIQRLWDQMNGSRALLFSLNRALRKIKQMPLTGLDRQASDQQRLVQSERKVLPKRLRMWDDVERQVAKHIDAKPTGLELHSPPNDRDAMMKLLHDALHALANPNAQSDKAADHSCYPDIPLPIKGFEDLMRIAYRLLLVQGRSQSARFLDVGCGGGSKVLAANMYIPQCEGLDYDHDYVKAGQKVIKLVDARHCRIFQADGLTYDGYAQYDVIYFYRPLNKDELLAEMENQILKTARPGTIIIAPYRSNLAPRDDFHAANIIGPIFLAGATQAEADALRHEAERTGTDLITRPKDKHFDPGFWSPILEAASFN